MLYREAGQFKTSYIADSQIFPIRQDRIGMLLLLAVAAVSSRSRLGGTSAVQRRPGVL